MTDMRRHSLKQKLLLPAVAVVLIAAGIFAGAGDAQVTPSSGASSQSLFEKAIAIIKKYEGMHAPRHWPLVGYGHKVLPGEKYSRRRQLSETEADSLLRTDLRKNCAVFREFGADSLILGVLAYNIGSGNVKRSSVTALLRGGNRAIRDYYLRHCRYRGKVLSQLQRRRAEEFDSLFVIDPPVAAPLSGVLDVSADGKSARTALNAIKMPPDAYIQLTELL